MRAAWARSGATDTKLNREVAIKILPDAFANDSDRLARFQREAQVLALLNHPKIPAIYGVEERALVMELVEGPNLAERIARGPILLEDALPIARQIAEALEYAHERGIVHRDLKPANIKVTPDGRVKVLDFGLAKALADEFSSGDPSTSPTVTMRETQVGAIMGTPADMSPEQARGQNVHRRADIWAFGVVLYEMLGGRTNSDSLAAFSRAKSIYRRFRRRQDRCWSGVCVATPVVSCFIKRMGPDHGGRQLKDWSCPWVQRVTAPYSHSPIWTSRRC